LQDSGQSPQPPPPINGSYWHVAGLTVFKAADNGIYVAGNHNVIENCVTHGNRDTGLQLGRYASTASTQADWPSDNGFKLGGEDIAVAHVVTRSVAFANGKNGFTWNSNPGAIRLSNTLSFDNADGNYRFGDNSTPTQAVFTNNVSFWTLSSTQSDKTVGDDAGGSNCFWSSSGTPASKSAKGLTVSAADFAAPLGKATVTRATDGTLDFSPFALAPASPLINAGVMPAAPLPFDAAAYYRSMPDLGAVEAK